MNKNELIKSGLLEEYVLGLTSPQESEIVESLMKKDIEIARMVEEMKGAMENYCKSIIKPAPEHVKNKVLRNIGVEDKDAKVLKVPESARNHRSIWKRIGPFAAAAAMALLIISLTLFGKNQKLQNELITYQERVERMKNESKTKLAEMTLFKEQATFLMDIRTAHIHLNGTEKAPQATAVAYWNPLNKKAYLNIIDLPSPPNDMTYQLWADVEGEMVNMGLLENIPHSWLELPFIPHAESLNVTLEKEGGSPSPNTDQIFIRGTVQL